MADSIVVLNAGSPSIKSSLIVLRGKELRVAARGQIEGLLTSPTFVSTDERGKGVSEEALPEVPEAREKEKEWLPKSFDELAVHLEQKFARLEADVEQMRKELREAEEQSEQLRHRLLDGRSF